MTKPAGISKLKTKLDKVFSQFIRIRNTDDHGWGHCVTCSKSLFWKEGDAGHFISRTYLNTRFEPMNVHLQCKGCNGYRAGEQFKHGLVIDHMYGPGMSLALLSWSQKSVKWDRLKYQQEITKYTDLVKELKSSKGLE